MSTNPHDPGTIKWHLRDTRMFYGYLFNEFKRKLRNAAGAP